MDAVTSFPFATMHHDDNNHMSSSSTAATQKRDKNEEQYWTKNEKKKEEEYFTLHFVGDEDEEEEEEVQVHSQGETVKTTTTTATTVSSGASSLASLSPRHTATATATTKDNNKDNHRDPTVAAAVCGAAARNGRRCSSPFVCSSETDGGLTYKQEEEEEEDAESLLSLSACLRFRPHHQQQQQPQQQQKKKSQQPWLPRRSPTQRLPPQEDEEEQKEEEEEEEKEAQPRVTLTPCAVGVNTLFCTPEATTATGGTGWAEVTAALQDALQQPVALKLHEHSAGGTYMVEKLPAKRRMTAAERYNSSFCCPPESPTATTIAVFKPKEEEIGQEQNPHHNTESDRTECFAPGSGSAREVLAYLLDHQHLAGVPPTMEVARVIEASSQQQQQQRQVVGSLQRFTPGCKESCDVLPGGFAAAEVHAIALFDIRTLNGDRHGGNILVQQLPEGEGEGQTAPHLIPIDHSYICPCGYADPDYEWLEWPQAKLPFSEAHLAYIAALDATKDAALVREVLSLRRSRARRAATYFSEEEEEEEDAEAAAEVVACATRLLQIAALEFQLTCCEIGRLCRRPTIASTSVLEVLLAESRDSTTWRVRMDRFEARARAILTQQTRK